VILRSLSTLVAACSKGNVYEAPIALQICPAGDPSIAKRAGLDRARIRILILEMDGPFDGVIQVSAEPLRFALTRLEPVGGRQTPPSPLLGHVREGVTAWKGLRVVTCVTGSCP
jgi:hypothetical protein